MSWIVEQSENTSAVNINDDTITCTKDGHYDSPINVMYKDPADQNGDYYWQLEFKELDSEGNASVGLTTEQGFKQGWGLKAMKYLGNLSDGSGLLVQRFGDQIQQNDTIGILLQLTDADLKMYIFHNERSLGLAFHIQSPYPKPLYPVISFDANGKVTISRIQRKPASLNRTLSQFLGAEGDWKIVDYPQHPECIDCQFEINRQDHVGNLYHLRTRVVNYLNCNLEHIPKSNQWKPSHIMSTMMAGSLEEMNKERVITTLISSIQSLEVQDDQQLIVKTNCGEQIRLERFLKSDPPAVTKNIFTD